MPEKLPSLDQALAKASKQESNFNYLLLNINDPRFATAKRQGFGKALTWANSERRRVLLLENDVKAAQHERDLHRATASAVYQAATGQLTEGEILSLEGLNPGLKQQLLDLTAVYQNHLALLEMLGPQTPGLSPTYTPGAETVGAI